MEMTGKENLTGNGLTISKSCVRKIYTSPNQNSPITKQMEAGGNMFFGHLHAFCPWISQAMWPTNSHNLRMP